MARDWRIEQARRAIGENDLDAARRILAAHLAEHPRDADALALAREVDDAMAAEGPEAAPRRSPRPTAVAPPLGVQLVVAVQVVVGGFFGVLGLVAVGADHASGMIGVMLGVAAIVVAVGLWRLRNWAWLAAIALGGLGIVMGVIDVVGGDAWGGLGVALNLAIIAYLVRVAERFGPAASAAPGGRASA